MIVTIDEQIAIEVTFSSIHREDGFDDDIYFCIHEQGPQDMRVFSADKTSLLLTPNQAVQLAAALTQAAEVSRQTPR